MLEMKKYKLWLFLLSILNHPKYSKFKEILEIKFEIFNFEHTGWSLDRLDT